MLVGINKRFCFVLFCFVSVLLSFVLRNINSLERGHFWCYWKLESFLENLLETCFGKNVNEKLSLILEYWILRTLLMLKSLHSSTIRI